jgi:predicted nucleic acid-binding protein
MESRFVVVNTSPLLYLHQAGVLELLHKLYGTVHTPNAVIQELQAGQQQGVSVPQVGAMDWIDRVTLPSTDWIPDVTDLGEGEAEVIAVGRTQVDSLLVIDDALGRRIAQLYGLRYTGTLGVLLKAKQLGHIRQIQPVLEQLQGLGMWLSDGLIQQVLHSANEAE